MLVNANTRIVHLTTAPTDPKWNQNFGVLGSKQQISVPASGSFCLTKARGSREEVTAQRCEDIDHKAQNPIRDWNTSFLPPRSVLPVALTGYSASSWKFTGEVHQRLHLSWSGMFQTKFCEKSCVSQRWLVFNRFSLGCFSGQTAQPQRPVVSGRGHPPGLHQPQLGFSAACFFFPFRSFKRSYFCLLQNGKHLLKCQGFFTSDTSFFFPDWPCVGTYTLVPFLQPSPRPLPRIAAFCTPRFIWSRSIWQTAPLRVVASFANVEFALMQLMQRLGRRARTPPRSPKSSTDEKKRQHKRARRVLAVLQPAERQLPSAHTFWLWRSSLRLQFSSKSLWRTIHT